MAIYQNVLELIGNTPIVRVQQLDTGPCELYLKLESTNPGGSIKDRIALKMIEAAEARGDLKPGSILVEGTAGNTGLGLALVAASKGYRLILVIPDKMSREKISNLKAMGAEVVITRSDVGKGHPEYYQDLAKKIADETPGSYFINQFGNPDNPLAHETMTGPEIWQQMGEDLDAIVIGVGSSGTITGLSRYFARTAPDLELVLADPEGSILADYIATGHVRDDAGGWLVEGIGEDFLPSISDFSRVSKAYSISDRESFVTARKLLQTEGLMGGSSTGTLVAAALRYCQEQTKPKKVLSLVCDTGNRYLSKVYNDHWMREHGLLAGSNHGDLRDLIARPTASRDAVTVGHTESLANAYKRMMLYDISQLPVMDGDRIVGIIDESDILLHVYIDEGRFGEPVTEAMVTKLESVDYRAPLDDLLPIFDKDRVAIVMDDDHFLGLITRVDLLNHLRRRAARI
ncbi:MAG: pyridoxal-phosphate dependent enzyme [Wenzhouxiangella sp.]|jgi:cystathionine beta-synthase|nr:pyridoxal-phosphate dependent enzyme [Wenzhouxiangella sp.]